MGDLSADGGELPVHRS